MCAFVLAAALFVLAACRSGGTAEGTAYDHEHGEGEEHPAVTLTEGQMGAAAVEIGQAEIRSMTGTVRASGVVGFNERKRVCLTARVSGWVEELHVFAGERVRAGQVLLALYSPDLLAAQAEHLQIASRLARALEEGDGEAMRVAERMLGSSAGKLEILGFPAHRLKEIRERNEPDQLLVLTAPFAASVLESQVVNGDRVEVGAELLSLADLNTVWVQVNVYEKDLAGIRPGAAAEISVEAYPGRVYRGRVTLIHDTLDEASRTVKARVELGNPGHELKPGMVVWADIVRGDTEKLLVVPEKAVRLIEGKFVVFIPAGDGRFEAREFRAGRTFPGFVEVLGGLAAGERVVTEGSFTLKSEALKKTYERDEHGHD